MQIYFIVALFKNVYFDLGCRV